MDEVKRQKFIRNAENVSHSKWSSSGRKVFQSFTTHKLYGVGGRFSCTVSLPSTLVWPLMRSKEIEKRKT